MQIRDWHLNIDAVKIMEKPAHSSIVHVLLECRMTLDHSISQDLETGCLKLAIVKFQGVQISKGDHNLLRFIP